MTRALTFAVALSALSLFTSGVTRAQQAPPIQQSAAKSCLHGSGEAADQAARRREALGATRTINNIQANRVEARDRKYLRQDELAGAPFAVNMKDSQAISLNPSQDILPGWKLTLDVSRERLLVHDQGHDRPVRLRLHQQSQRPDLHSRSASLRR